MLKLKKIAITGPVSSGKSTVCSLFEKLGAYVVDADTIVHQLLSSSTDLGKKVISLLGEDIVEDGQLSRKKIAKAVFQEPRFLKQLEEWIHPEVRKEIEKQYRSASHEKYKYPLFIAEIPLLFEGSFEQDYHFVILVIADEKRCKKRFIEATHYQEDEFYKRSARLIPLEEKKKRADLIIENNGSLEELQQSVEKVFYQLSKQI